MKGVGPVFVLIHVTFFPGIQGVDGYFPLGADIHHCTGAVDIGIKDGEDKDEGISGERDQDAAKDSMVVIPVYRTGRKMIFPALFAQDGGYGEFIIDRFAAAGPDESPGVGSRPVLRPDAFAAALTAVGIRVVAGQMFFCEVQPVKIRRSL